jgi:hypothetical protein
VLVSCSTNAKYSLRGGTVGSKNKGLWKKQKGAL